MIASYGVRGGHSASTHLHDVVKLLKMRPTDLSPAFTVTRDMSGEDGKIKDISEAFEPYVAMLKEAGDELLAIGTTPEAVIA